MTVNAREWILAYGAPGGDIGVLGVTLDEPIPFPVPRASWESIQERMERDQPGAVLLAMTPIAEALQ